MLLIIAEHGLPGSMDKEDGLGHKNVKNFTGPDRNSDLDQ